MSPSAVTDAGRVVPAAGVSTKGSLEEEEAQKKQQKEHIHGQEGLTGIKALSHGGISIPGTVPRPKIPQTGN